MVKEKMFKLHHFQFHIVFVFLMQNFAGHLVWWYLIFSLTGIDFTGRVRRSYSVSERLQYVFHTFGTRHKDTLKASLLKGFQHTTRVLETDCTRSSKVVLPHQKGYRWLWSKESLRSRKKAQSHHHQSIILRTELLCFFSAIKKIHHHTWTPHNQD